ncbi:MAG: hypothetical protein SGI72_01895, partial [Planctomycetota bacterium]|nr:hypothetical protein [Planctomycetota bacterium]
MKLRTHGLVALATAMLATSSFAQTSFPEVEPNSTKAEATAVTGIVAGDSITGTSTGIVTTVASTLVTTLDTYRIKNSALPLGIYKHTLTITSAVVGHTGTIRGLNQTGTAGTASTGGTPGTVDTLIQTSSTTSVNPPPRSNVWYGFGKQEELYYRVTGGAATTAAYTSTLSTAGITATVLPQAFESGSAITVTTVGQAVADTDIHIYDSNLDAIPGASNDDEGPVGATIQSRLIRTLPAGTYYLAVGRFSTAWNIADPADEDFIGTLMDFPGSLVCSSLTPTTGTDDRDFQISAANGIFNQANTITAPDSYSIQWFQFTTQLGAPPIFTPPPANDNCAAATALPAAGATTAGSMAGATNDGLASCDAGGAASRDVWYSWTNTSPGLRTFSASTCGTTGLNDTVVSIYASCGGAELGCNDDNGACAAQPLSSLVSGISVNPAQTILIRISDKALGGTTQNFSVVTTVGAPAPSNDDCSTPIVLSGPGIYSFDTTGATTGTQGQGLTVACGTTSSVKKDIWYTYTASVNGTVTFSTCGLTTSTDTDTKISYYAGAGCPVPPSPIGCDDDLCVTPTLNTILTFSVLCGEVYTIQLGNFGATANIFGQFSVTEAGPSCSTPFTVFCDGSTIGTTCVACGNNGVAGKGCANSVFPGGTQLVSGGIASVSLDTMTLTTSDMTGPGLFFQSSGLAPTPIGFGDGMLCAAVGI